jgi:hypothetical protein
MNTKDVLDIVVIPLTLALIAILWPEIQSWSRRRVFQGLIWRELLEVSPYPTDKAKLKGWWMHCQKRFIHREIFNNVKENRDFILSLNPDLVYMIAQLWQSLDDHNWDQWKYCLEELGKHDQSGKITSNLAIWKDLYSLYADKK